MLNGQSRMLIFFLVAATSLTCASAADHWPQFRGPTGDGHADADGLPITWSEKENIVWKTPIHDRGWSSPVIWGKQVWMTTATADGHEMFAVCVALDSGEILHDVNVFTNEEIVQEIGVDFREEGRRHFILDVAVRGYDAEEENNRREIVIEGEKAGVRVLVVDQRPAWELRFLSGFLRKDQTFDFDLVSILADHSSLDGARTIAPGDFVRRLREYDALVLISMEKGFIDEQRAAAIRRFVRVEGKGLLILPGPGSLFERSGAWGRLSDVLPVRGNAPLRFQNQYTIVRPGPQAMSNPMTTRLVPRLSQTDWQQRSPLLGHYAPITPKPGVEIHCPRNKRLITLEYQIGSTAQCRCSVQNQSVQNKHT